MPYIKWDKKRFKIVITIIVIVGLIFPMIYINAPYKIIEIVTKVTNKSFYSGREIIWARVYAAMKDPIKILIGVGSENSISFGIIGNNRYSLHSSYLTMYAYYGVIGVLIYYNQIIRCIDKVKITNRKLVLIAGYLSLMITGFSEIVLCYSYQALITNIIFGMAVSSVE